MIDRNDHYQLRADYNALSDLAKNLGQTLVSEASKVRSGNLPDELLLNRLHDFNCLSGELKSQFSQIADREFGKPFPKNQFLSLQTFQSLLETLPVRSDAIAVLKELEEQNTNSLRSETSRNLRLQEIHAIREDIQATPITETTNLIDAIAKREHPICVIPSEPKPDKPKQDETTEPDEPRLIDTDDDWSLEGLSGTFTIDNPHDMSMLDTQILSSGDQEQFIQESLKKSSLSGKSLPEEELDLQKDDLQKEAGNHVGEEISSLESDASENADLFELLSSEPEISNAIPAPSEDELRIKDLSKLIEQSPFRLNSPPTVNDEQPEPTTPDESEDKDSVFDDVQFAETAPLNTLDALVKSQSSVDENKKAEEPSGKSFVADVSTNSGSIDDDAIQPKHAKATEAVEPAIQSAVGESRLEVQNLAGLARNLSGIDRDKAIVELIWQLINSGKTSFAYHLSRILESRNALQDSQTFFLPSWLIRAIGLSPLVYFSQGRVAIQVDTDLQNFRESLIEDRSINAEEEEALQFLLHAAALRSAIIHPSNASWNILRTFKINDGFTQLYNFTKRIISFGSSDGGIPPEVYAPMVGEASSMQKMLQREVSDWHEAISQSMPTFATSSPLYNHGAWSLRSSRTAQDSDFANAWSASQLQLSEASALLQPIKQHDLSRRTEVRKTLSRLSESLKTKPQQAESTPLLVSQSRELLQQALFIAERWLIISAKEVNESAFIPESVSDLKNEIQKRSPLVIQELLSRQAETSSVPIRAAIQCCLQAIKGISSLFNSKSAFPVLQEEPNCALNSELLKVPQIHLNQNWKVIDTNAVVEQEILHHLQQDNIGWKEAFHLHCTHSNHLATARLLKMNVWKSEKEKQQLTEIRSHNLKQCREIFDDEIRFCEQSIEEASSLKLLEPHDSASLQARLEALRLNNQKTLDYSQPMYELHQIQRMIDHRRKHEMEKVRERFSQLSQGSQIEDSLHAPQITPTSQTSTSESHQTSSGKEKDEDGGPEWILDVF